MATIERSPEETEPTKPIVEREIVQAAPRFPAAIDSQIFEVFDDTTTTPDVANIQYVRFQNTAPGFTVTNFLSGQEGQHLYVIGNGNIILNGVSEGTLFKINPTEPISQTLFTHLLFKDGVWGEVSVDLAQLIPGTGSIVQNTVDELFILVAGVPQDMDIPVDFNTNLPNRWTSPADGDLQFIGSQSRISITFVSFDLTPNQNNRTFIVDILVNDTAVSTISLSTGAAGDPTLVSISGIINLAQNDIIEARIASTTNTNADVNNFTIQSMDFFLGIIF